MSMRGVGNGAFSIEDEEVWEPVPVTTLLQLTNDKGDVVGEFVLIDNKTIDFEGQITECAKIFIDEVKKSFNIGE